MTAPDRSAVLDQSRTHIAGRFDLHRPRVLATLRECASRPLVTRDQYRVNIEVDPRLRPSEVAEAESFGDGELLVRRLDRPDTSR